MADLIPLTALVAGDLNSTFTANVVLLSGPGGRVDVNSNIYIDSSGNVGIGTSTMSMGSKLTVLGGNIQLSTAGSGIRYSDGSMQMSASSITGNLSVGNTGISTSTTSGALVVAGGVGIGGNLNVGGNRNFFTAGMVGIGTSTQLASTELGVWTGNLQIGSIGTGLLFPDGTFQTTASTGSSIAVTNDVATNANTYYPSLTNNVTSGTLSALVTSSTKLFYNPSTGTLTATAHAGNVEGGSVSGTIFNARTSVIAPTLTANTNIEGGSVSGTVFNARTSLIAATVTSNGAVSGTTITASTGFEGGSVSGTVFNARTSLIAATVTSNGAISGTTITTSTGFEGGSISGTVFNARTSLIAATVTSNGAVTGTTIIPTGSTAPSNGVYLPAANTLGFATNSTSAMQINSTSNVIIGSTAFATYGRLNVSGPTVATTANATTYGQVLYASSGNSDFLEITNTRNQSGGASWTSAGWRLQEKVDSTWMGYIQFNTGSGTVANNGGISFGTGTSTVGQNSVPEVMRIDLNGNMVLGATSAIYRFTAASSTNGNDGIWYTNNSTGASAQAVIALNTSGASGISMGQNYTSKSGFIYLADNSYLTISTNALERIRIDSLGNVMVGTSSTVAPFKFNVAGGPSLFNNTSNTGATARNYGVHLWNDTLFGMELGYNSTLAGYTTRIFTRDGSDGIEFGKFPTGSTTLVNQFSPWMVMNNSGNVGIGSSTPTASLDVVGTVSVARANIKNQTLTDGVTINWDTSLGQVATVTLTAAGRTMAAPTNLKVGTYILHVLQDATGSRTITSWNTVFKWVGGVAPTLTTTANARDVFSFVSDGTNLYGSMLPDVR